MSKTVSNDKLIQAVFTATDEAKERALEILEGKEPLSEYDGPLLLSMGQTCELMGLSRSSLWRLIKSGRLEKIQLHPGSFRIRKADVLDLIAGGRDIHEHYSSCASRPPASAPSSQTTNNE